MAPSSAHLNYKSFNECSEIIKRSGFGLFRRLSWDLRELLIQSESKASVEQQSNKIKWILNSGTKLLPSLVIHHYPLGSVSFYFYYFVFWENPVVWFFRSCSSWVRDIWCPWLQTRKPNLQRGLPIWIFSFFIVDFDFQSFVSPILAFDIFELLCVWTLNVGKVWQTASLYHLVHTAALVATPITKHPNIVSFPFPVNFPIFILFYIYWDNCHYCMFLRSNFILLNILYLFCINKMYVCLCAFTYIYIFFSSLLFQFGGLLTTGILAFSGT